MLWTPDDVGALWSRIFDRAKLATSHVEAGFEGASAVEQATDAVERILKASKPSGVEKTALQRLLDSEFKSPDAAGRAAWGKAYEDSPALHEMKYGHDISQQPLPPMNETGAAFKPASVDLSHPIDSKPRCIRCGVVLTGSCALGGLPVCSIECDKAWQESQRKGPSAVTMTSLPPFVARAAVIRADTQEEADTMRAELLDTWKEKPAVCTCAPTVSHIEGNDDPDIITHEPTCNLRAGTVAPTEESA